MRAVEKYQKTYSKKLIEESPSSNLGIVITIPAYNEAETIKSIESILDCEPPNVDVEILVNVNFSESVSENEKLFNRIAFQVLKKYEKEHSTSHLKIHSLFFPDQASKKAGVGWARKQIMDEAFRRLLSIGNESGIIVGFDADSTCEPNYLKVLETFFNSKSDAVACSIRFEHPISGYKYSSSIYQAITLYELHLRYYVNAQKLIGTPYAFQTVGSSFAVRAKDYAAVNGMSPKKAGEDFYFLQKIIALGGFYNLNSTCVYPSPRISKRVGFGTGPSVDEISKSGYKHTYNYNSFLEIKKLYDSLPQLFNQKLRVDEIDLHPLFIDYLRKQKAQAVISNLIRNHKIYDKFKSAFMQWFGGFQILKILNILRTNESFRDEDVVVAINRLGILEPQSDAKQLLIDLRHFDNNNHS